MGKYLRVKHSVWGKVSVIVAALLLGQLAGIATAHAASADITINEISSYDSSGDWVELYNSGTAPIDISSWSLRDASLTVVKSDAFSAKTIPAGGFVIVDFGSALDETGDTISLYDADISTLPLTPPIQMIEYGTGSIPAPAESANSVARSYDGASTWTVGVATKELSNGLPPDAMAPPVPTDGQSAINGNSVTLSWSAVIDDRLGDVSYKVRYATSQGGLVTATPMSVNTNQFVVSLLEGNYFWQVQAIDASDNASDWSETWQFTVPSADTTAPGAPASSVSSGEVLAGNKIIETTPTSDTASWRFEIHQTSTGQLILTSSDPSFLFDTLRFANGQYILKYIVTDATGNTATYDIPFSIANIVETEVPQLPTAPSLVQSSDSLVTQATSNLSTSTSSSLEDEATTATTGPQINIGDVLSKNKNDSLAVAATDKGWQFYGYPWYVWAIGGLGVSIAGWLVRKIIITRGGGSNG